MAGVVSKSSAFHLRKDERLGCRGGLFSVVLQSWRTSKVIVFQMVRPVFRYVPGCPLPHKQGGAKMKSCVGRRTIKKIDMKLPVFRAFSVLENSREQENRPVP
jgi:hypothetical protein